MPNDYTLPSDMREADAPAQTPRPASTPKRGPVGALPPGFMSAVLAPTPARPTINNPLAQLLAPTAEQRRRAAGVALGQQALQAASRPRRKPSVSNSAAPGAVPAPAHLPSEAGRQAGPSSVMDVLKSIPNDLYEGIVSIPGIPGDMRDLGNNIGNWTRGKLGTLYDYATNPNLSWSDASKQSAQEDAATAQRQAEFMQEHPEWRHYVQTQQLAGHPPTSQDLINAADKGVAAVTEAATGTPYIPYKPQTRAGRLTRDVVSAIPAAALTGGESLTANVARELPAIASSGLAGGLLREATGPDSEYAPYAQVAGNILGAIGHGGISRAAAARSPEAVAARADQIASQALREAPLNPEVDAAKLAAFNANPPKLLPNVEPTTAQAARSPSLQAMERRVTDIGREQHAERTGAAPAASEMSRNAVESGESVGPNGERVSVPNVVGAAIPETDLASTLGASHDMQGNAAIRGKEVISKAEQSLKDTEQQAWQKVNDQSPFYGAPMLNDLNQKIAGLTTAKAEDFPNSARSIVRKLTDQFGATNPELEHVTEQVGDTSYRFDPTKKDWVEADTGDLASTDARQILNDKYAEDIKPAPLSEIQDLRHALGEKANAAYAAGNKTTGNVLRDLADTIKGHLEDPTNFRLGDEGQSQAWSDAVKASRDYNESFGSGIGRSLTAADTTGAPSVAGEGTFARMFAGDPGAVQRYRQLRETPGIDADALDNAATDWMMGKLTKNGTKTDLTNADVTSFANDPKNAAIIKEVPPLQDKIASALELSAKNDKENALRGTVDAFNKTFNAGNPQRLASFMSDNMDDLKAATPPEAHDFLDQLHNSARIIQKIPEGTLRSDETLRALRKGSLLTLLYGKGTGILSDSLALEALAHAGKAAGVLHGGMGIGALTGAVMGAAGKVGGVRAALESSLSRMILGNTRQEAIERLQAAMADPKLAQALMEKPSPESINRLANAMSDAGLFAAKQGAYAAVRPSGKNEEHPSSAQSKPVSAPPSTYLFNPDTEVPTDSALDNPLFRNDPVPMDDAAPTSKALPDLEQIPEPTSTEPVARASGGRVGNVEHLVNRLMRGARKAKKDINKHTEGFLKHDDSTIVAALNTAKRAI